MIRRIQPQFVRTGSKIVCRGHVVREVFCLEHGEWGKGPAYRFTFTDGTWLECPEAERVTVIV